MLDINRLEGVQRSAARFVCSEYRRGPGISVTALLQQLQWPSLADRRLIARFTLSYNAHTGKINIPLCNFVDRSDSRTSSTKNYYKYISTKLVGKSDWIEMAGGARVFTCRGSREVTRLPGEEYVIQIMESMKVMVMGQGVEEKGG